MTALKVFFVTSNDSKVATCARVLGRHHIGVERVDRELIEIQATTVVEVVTHKVRAAMRELQAPVIVNDGGVHLDAWGGFPGPYVKHVNRQLGISGYLKLLEGFPPERRGASVESAVAYFAPDRPAPVVFGRTIRGVISTEPRGTHRKGRMALSQVFIPDGYDKTYAEMTNEEYEAFRSTPESEKMYEALADAINGTQQSFE